MGAAQSRGRPPRPSPGPSLGAQRGLSPLWPMVTLSMVTGLPRLCPSHEPSAASPHTEPPLLHVCLLLRNCRPSPSQVRAGRWRISDRELLLPIRCAAGPWGRGSRASPLIPLSYQTPPPPGRCPEPGRAFAGHHHGNQERCLSPQAAWNRPWDRLPAGRAMGRGPRPLDPHLSHQSSWVTGLPRGCLQESRAPLIRGEILGTGHADPSARRGLRVVEDALS